MLVTSIEEPDSSKYLVTVMNGEPELAEWSHVRLPSETDVNCGFAEKWSQLLFP